MRKLGITSASIITNELISLNFETKSLYDEALKHFEEVILISPLSVSYSLKRKIIKNDPPPGGTFLSS